MSMTYSGDYIQFPDNTQMPTYPQGWRNRIINGDMRIDQRNAGAAVTITTDATYTLDRWSARCSVGSKYSVQQSTTAPAGFVNSALITSLSAYSISATDIFTFDQKIEGVNVSDLGWGTADAQSITISFRARSSLTGTFGGVVQNSAQNRSYPFTFTVNAANTWETKTVTIAGDTSGTWLKDTGVGLFLKFGLGVGSTYSGTAGAWAGADYRSATGATSVVGTNGATWYITGVQLEKGTVATPFEYLDYSEQLRRCQRYYFQTSSTSYCMSLSANGTSRIRGCMQLPTVLRASGVMTVSGTPSVYSYTSAVTYGSVNSYAAVNTTLMLDLGITGTASGGYDVQGVFCISAEL